MRIDIQGIFGPPSTEMFRTYPFFGPHEEGYRTFGMPRNRTLSSGELERINLDRKVLPCPSIQMEIESPQLLWLGERFRLTSEGIGLSVPKLPRNEVGGTFLIDSEAHIRARIESYLQRLARWVARIGPGSFAQVGAGLALNCAPTHPLTEWMGWFSQTSKEGRDWEVRKALLNRWETCVTSSSEIEEEFRKVNQSWGPA